MKRVLAIAATLSLLGGGQPREERRTAAVEALPPLFGPVTWESTVDQLRGSFSGGELEYNESIGRESPESSSRAFVGISSIALPEFGDARITIEQSPPGVSRVVRIETEDYRPACAAGGPPPAGSSTQCRWRSPNGLRSVVGHLRRVLVATYGNPVRSTSTPEGEREYVWRRRGYVLSLLLERDDEGYWAAVVVAVRGGRN